MQHSFPACLLASILVTLAAGCASGPALTGVADTLHTHDGRTHAPTPIPPDVRAEREALLAAAAASFEAGPDEIGIIWYGRRLAYLGRYSDAIAVFTHGLERYPESSRLYRHRGHRQITLRRFRRAVADFERAAALEEGRPDRVEPDGLPNARNEPRSTTQGNIAYHLGLAHYLLGDYEGAVRGYERSLALADNDDMHVAAAYWLSMSLARAGRPAEATDVLAAIRPDMDVIENMAYLDLLLLFRGELDAERALGAVLDGDDPVDPTRGYGVWWWLDATGNGEAARRVRDRVLAGDSWASFGYIAAEADATR